MAVEWPIILGAGYLFSGELSRPDRPILDAGAQWVQPLPVFRGYKPEVSDGFQGAATTDHRQHLGVDIMYRRKRSGVVTPPEEAIDGKNGSKLYWVPAGMVAYACHDGIIWNSKRTELGHSVLLDCGKPYAVFYQHLSTLLVPIGIAGGKLNGRPYPVRAGDPLGVVGGDMRAGGYPLRHLHLEIWRGGGRESAVDPRSSDIAGGVAKWTAITLKE